MSKYGLNEDEIETLKEAIDILNDIGCDQYANNIREILEEEVKENTSYNPTTALKYEVGKTEEDVRIVLIRLQYARQKIEHIESTLKQSSVFSAGELRANINSAINTLKIAKANTGTD